MLKNKKEIVKKLKDDLSNIGKKINKKINFKTSITKFNRLIPKIDLINKKTKEITTARADFYSSNEENINFEKNSNSCVICFNFNPNGVIMDCGHGGLICFNISSIVNNFFY